MQRQEARGSRSRQQQGTTRAGALWEEGGERVGERREQPTLRRALQIFRGSNHSFEGGMQAGKHTGTNIVNWKSQIFIKMFWAKRFIDKDSRAMVVVVVVVVILAFVAGAVVGIVITVVVADAVVIVFHAELS